MSYSGAWFLLAMTAFASAASADATTVPTTAAAGATTLPANYDTAISYGAEDLFSAEEFAELRDRDQIELAGVSKKDVAAVLARVGQMPKLTVLALNSCDLARVDENSPAPAKVKRIVISGGKVSQGTIRWLATFPAGTTLEAYVCDTRGLEFELGKFTWVTFDNCKVSRSAVVKLVEKMTQVTFKEVELSDN